LTINILIAPATLQKLLAQAAMVILLMVVVM
jgi:hypothetical protein